MKICKEREIWTFYFLKKCLYLYDVNVWIFVFIFKWAIDLVVFEPLNVGLEVTHDHFTFKLHVIHVGHSLVHGTVNHWLCQNPVWKIHKSSHYSFFLSFNQKYKIGFKPKYWNEWGSLYYQIFKETAIAREKNLTIVPRISCSQELQHLSFGLFANDNYKTFSKQKKLKPVEFIVWCWR